MPASEQLSSTSDRDSATLCKEIGDFEGGPNNAKLSDFSCRLTALVAAALSGATCTATVAELAACLNDSGPYVDQALTQIPSCAALTQTSSSSTTSTSTAMSPASCTSFEAKCPDSGLPLPGAGT